MDADRAKTPAEKQFKAAMRKAGWQVYRDSETGRLVTNLYRREVAGLSEKIGMALEIVCSEGSMVKASPVEVVAPAAASAVVSA
ncbi:hypothetical protein [Duganella vulcania]|uniref:Uncharacterized protein n=1 Tax=Duganella vulcania TaxID=2692166 RepID=A0A845GGS5_9BURK|nr:hypothetical protein [Duganella vulcania]MYM92622.1 hypothetical protein [Duganella vulcania]